MSITDELRKWLNSLYTPNSGAVKDEGERIADRIDAEHQKALDEWKAKHGQMWLKGYSEYHAELLEGNETLASDLERCGWIRLPKDADGVPIRMGDKVDSDHYEDGTVTGIQFYEMANGGIRTLIAVRPDGWDVPTWHTPDEYRHHHAPTVEDVLREFGKAWVEWEDGSPYDPIAKYAKRLTLADGKDA